MANKELKDMTVEEIVQGVRSGKIESCKYKTFEDYLQQMKKN